MAYAIQKPFLRVNFAIFVHLLDVKHVSITNTITLVTNSQVAVWVDVTLIQFDVRYEPPHDKTKKKMTVRPAKTQISLGIRPVWSESSLALSGYLRTQAFFMPRLMP